MSLCPGCRAGLVLAGMVPHGSWHSLCCPMLPTQGTQPLGSPQKTCPAHYGSQSGLFRHLLLTKQRNTLPRKPSAARTVPRKHKAWIPLPEPCQGVRAFLGTPLRPAKRPLPAIRTSLVPACRGWDGSGSVVTQQRQPSTLLQGSHKPRALHLWLAMHTNVFRTSTRGASTSVA